ncbi:MAG TPA: glycosyltransferase family 39 protein [Thermoanaerobaculia bacterium]|nr:glycosyltransferase family 39 protein [Thermoanaerobaculia bacterium]
MKHWHALLALIVLLTLARIATTHRVFSQTFDEPYHLIAGYDVLVNGNYRTDPPHPPLRALFALPFLDTPSPAGTDVLARGNALLLRNERYTQNIARARLGNLLFVAIGIIVVAAWARRLLSPKAGLVAAALYASLPPVLAHGGLATTDMASAATLPLALFALDVFLERSTWRNTTLLGLAMAAGMLSKYSFLLFFPVCAAILFVIRRRFPAARIAVATLITALVVWAAYGFAFETMQSADPRSRDMAREVFGSSWIADVPVPAPMLAVGVLEVKRHDLHGHRAFLLGEHSDEGWWYYFPVALFYKTPIPFLLLALIGGALLARRAPEVVLIALAILGLVMTSSINIGVRHVLPIYAPLAIAAAAAVMRMKWTGIALAAWLVVGSALAHPDYLPWFNAFAGNQPERILADSNLDWGQDALRLARYARQEKLPHITTSLLGTTPLDQIGLPPRTELRVFEPLHGWVAISEGHLILGRALDPKIAQWLDREFGPKTYRRIGKTIRLYHFPPMV